MLISRYFIYNETFFRSSLDDFYPETSQNIKGQIHIACRFKLCCEPQFTVSVKERQCEQKSCYELGTDIAGEFICAGLQSATDSTDFLVLIAYLLIFASHAETAAVTLHFFFER